MLLCLSLLLESGVEVNYGVLLETVLVKVVGPLESTLKCILSIQLSVEAGLECVRPQACLNMTMKK